MALYRKFTYQAIRFGMVGAASNVLLYLLYWVLTSIGLEYKIAMTLLFAAGTLQTFAFNKRWTFAHQGLVHSSFVRYVLTYSFAYLLNLAVLVWLVDRLGFPHQVIQGVMIPSIAAILFLLQRHWVFRVSDACNK